ncbi:MAG: tryptophan--tRNA ligase [Acidobacteriaceae bacterium]|nr:tryptophan--tRNA ligase [Acidobacteriaceae bacterium]
MNVTNTTNAPRRVLSGMRPTGKLHLGNYMGALRNWVTLQDETNADGSRKYEGYYFIADLHALTTDYADTSGIQQNIQDVALDFLAGGLDPERSTIFVQSDVPQHSELHLLLSMITPLSWLERVPTYKDQQEQLKEKDLATYGFLGYPLLMAADILLYRPDYVPVGQDQAAHVEITREIARKFNSTYPRAKSDVLPEPKVLFTPSPKLPGTDGRKMSKSYGNTIMLTDSEADLRKKLKTMVTDPARIRRTDPGNPEVCPVGDLHKVFSSDETRLKVWEGCTTAGIGCIECKGWAADGIVAVLNPIQERRRHYESNPQLVTEILAAGGERARASAEATMQQVRGAMKMRVQ